MLQRQQPGERVETQEGEKQAEIEATIISDPCSQLFVATVALTYHQMISTGSADSRPELSTLNVGRNGFIHWIMGISAVGPWKINSFHYIFPSRTDLEQASSLYM